MLASLEVCCQHLRPAEIQELRVKIATLTLQMGVALEQQAMLRSEAVTLRCMLRASGLKIKAQQQCLDGIQRNLLRVQTAKN
jgi:hypothetical protein